MSKNRKQKMITPEIMRQAVVGAFTKLDPRYMMKNPVMFVVEIGFVISLVLSFAPGLLGDTTPNARVYNSIVSAILLRCCLQTLPNQWRRGAEKRRPPA